MSIYFGEFQPHKVANTQLYIQRKDSTVSLCPDYSANGYDFTQGVAANQPTLGTNSIDFTTNDFMLHSVSDAFGSDNSGYIFFSGYYNSSAVNRILASGDTATPNHWLALSVLNTTHKVGFFVSIGGVVTSVTMDTTALTNGDFYHGWIRSDGTNYTAKLNGVSQTLTGTNNGLWFNDVSFRDNLVIGALIRSTNLFGSAQINKVHYVSGSPSALDVWKCEQFFSNPLNYI